MAAPKRPQIMGILNITPDSFYGGSRLMDPFCALDKALEMVSEGADWIDVGGESTRPGALAVDLEEESARVLPVVYQLTKNSQIKVSLDTQKPELMVKAIDLGVQFINDVNALCAKDAISMVAQSGVQVCLMHKKGNPQSMQQEAQYDDCVTEVKTFLEERVQIALDAGITKDRLWIDPGFCFGKYLEHNLKLLHCLETFQTLQLPILVGLSRKSMLGHITGKKVEDRLPASIAAHLLAVERGASMVRVHDVGPTVDALKVYWAMKQGKELW